MSTSLTISPNIGQAPLTVNFSGSTNLFSGVYSWDFGDGNTGTGIAPSNIYTATGVYDVVLTVSGLGTSGIYLTTYIKDDFSNSGIDPLWNSGFLDVAEIVDCSGWMARGGGSVDSWLTPSGLPSALITGRFDFQWDWAMGCTNGGNVSLHFYLRNASDVKIHALDWNGGLQYDGVDAGLSSDSWVAGRRYTVRMTRGYSLDASGNATPESVEVIRSYYLDNWSGGATNNWIEFSSSPESGAANAVDSYIEINHATYNGFDNFVLQADGGLPYSGGIVGTLEYASGIVTVGSGYGEIVGDVAGIGFINGTVTEDISYSGVVGAWGDIRAAMSFVYQPTPVPPSGSSTALKSIRTVLTNKNRYPYKIPSDTIVSKVDIFDKGRISYRQNVPVELYFNYSGDWWAYESGVTDRYGSIRFTHPTAAIPYITNCLGIAKATIDGKEYTSNLMRYNFVRGKAHVDLLYLIDAGSGPEMSGDALPTGIEYSTYLWDDFGDNSGIALLSGFWEPTWTGIYGPPVTRSGQYVVCDNRGYTDSFVDALTPGQFLSGDFSVVAECLHGSGWSYQYSYSAIALFTSVDAPAHPSYQLGWTNQTPGDAGSGSFRFLPRVPPGGSFGTAVYSDPQPWGSGYAFRLKFERTDDTLRTYYDYNSGLWTELGSGLTLSGNISLTNVQTYSSTRGGEVSAAFDKLIFQAEYGLPGSGAVLEFLDRSAYDTFDGSGRLNTFDRMWSE